MRTENFLNDLDELMPEHPYKERWLKELDAHLDDFEDDLQREGRTLTPLTLAERMGTPKRILSDFYKTLHPWRTVYYLAEALFTGLIFLTISMGMMSLNWALGGLIDVIIDWNEFSPTVLFEGLFALAFMYTVWYLLHSLSWRQGQNLKKETGYSLLPWALLTLAPVLLMMGMWYGRLFGFAIEDPQTCPDCEPTWLGILKWTLSVGNYLLIYLGAAFFAYRKQAKIAQNKIHTPKPKKWEKIWKGLFAIYLISFSVVHAVSVWGLFIPPDNLFFSTLLTLYMPLFMCAWMLQVIGLIILSFNGGMMYLAIPAVYFMGSLLAFIILQSLVHMIYRRKWSWLRFGMILVVVPILFNSPNHYNPAITSNKPYTIVSNAIEKEQTGIFYNLLKFANQDEGHMFHYAVDFQNGEFILQQNSGYEFHFEPGEWTEETVETFVDQRIKIEDMTAEGATWPEDFYCSTETISEEGTITINPSLQEHGDLALCTELFYNGESILKADYQKNLTDVAFSDDGHWMILVVKSGAYDPDYVYLIEL